MATRESLQLTTWEPLQSGEPFELSKESMPFGTVRFSSEGTSRQRMQFTTQDPSATEFIIREFQLAQQLETEELIKQLSLQFSELKRRLDNLMNQQHTFVTFITSLGDDELQVIKPIPVTVRQDDDGYVASFFDANIGSGGETPQSAVSNLQSLIAEIFRIQEEESIEDLGPLMIKQRNVLLEVICRTSQRPMQKRQPANSALNQAVV